ncbi:response regulator transcription factor [Rhizobium leguminosarum]|uniref:response regulator transcription factor n=1 Tax=Rhizobium leguminosarum TaxID=384 RepID=UPI0004838200|nr:response regulator [Rhizobium leguminosarum]
MYAPLVVVIDDDPGMRWAIDALVRSLDYRCATFSSSEDFLASGVVSTCDCVVSDVQMRGMSGIDLALRLRGQSDAAGSVPVVLISAFADERMTQAANAANAVALLKKPFHGDALVHCIEQAIARRPSQTA